MKIERKTVAIILVATIGLSLFAGLASAVGNNPLQEILEILQGNKPKAIVFNKEDQLLPYMEDDLAMVELLPKVDGEVYCGHISASLTSWCYVKMVVTGFVGDRNVTLDSKVGDLTEEINTNFVCERLVLLVGASYPAHPIQGNLWGIVEYTTCTDISTLP